MNRTYIERQIRAGKWIPHTLTNGLKIYWSERASNFIEKFESKGDNFCPILRYWELPRVAVRSDAEDVIY